MTTDVHRRHTHEATGQDDLIGFRTLWMRVVAYAWVDSTFKNELIDQTKNPFDVIRRRFAFPPKETSPLPLESVLSLVVMQDPLEKKDAKRIEWIGDDWSWPVLEEEDEILTLNVPLEAPPALKVSPHDDLESAQAKLKKHAVALADYYRARPSLFGTNVDDHSVVPTTSSTSSSGLSLMAVEVNDTLRQAFMDTLGPGNSGIQFGSHGPLPNGFTPTQSSFLDLGVALTYVMAKAWENDAFRRLVKDSHTVTGAISRARGFVPPWAIKVAIAHDRTSQWHDEDPHEKDGKSGRDLSHDSRKSKLTLNLPVEPQEPGDYSVALAAYNSTGAQFPFTCCP